MIQTLRIYRVQIPEVERSTLRGEDDTDIQITDCGMLRCADCRCTDSGLRMLLITDGSAVKCGVKYALLAKCILRHRPTNPLTTKPH